MVISTAHNKGLWMAADSSPELSQGRCYGDSRSATIADLLVTILGVGHEKAQKVIQALCVQGNLLDQAIAWQRFREATPMELQAAGLTVPQVGKVQAAIELGRRAYVEKPSDSNPVIDDPAVAAALLGGDMMWQPVERFAVVALDIRHRVMGYEILSQGTKTQCLAHPREIFSWLLRVGAVRAIVAHNHPSGGLEPSPDDIELTKQLLAGAQQLAVPILDHLILGNGDYRSLRQTTTLWQEAPQID
jgi:DNA repair protein RadC